MPSSVRRRAGYRSGLCPHPGARRFRRPCRWPKRRRSPHRPAHPPPPRRKTPPVSCALPAGRSTHPYRGRCRLPPALRATPVQRRARPQFAGRAPPVCRRAPHPGPTAPPAANTFPAPRRREALRPANSGRRREAHAPIRRRNRPCRRATPRRIY